MKALPFFGYAGLAFLPRTILDRLEVHRLPMPMGRIPDLAQLRKFWSEYRIALLKQSLYRDLFCSPPDTEPAKVVRSSLRRTGPMGWLVDLSARFWMVHEDSSSECRAWEESVGSQPSTREDDLRKARAFPDEPLLPPHPFAGRTPHSLSISVHEVPWKDLDVVISLDVAIPERIRRSHPHIHWVYFPTDPGTPLAKSARLRPPAGFQSSLTHTHRRFPVRPRLGPNAVECPYSFQTSYSWNQVWPRTTSESGVMVEHQSFARLTLREIDLLREFGPVRKPAGSVNEVAKNLRASKYYLRLAGGPLSGNGQVEALMAGCLALGSPATYVQRSLFTPQTVCRDFPEALEKLRTFESDPGLFQQVRQEQQAIAEWICFRRPAWELWQRIRQTR